MYRRLVILASFYLCYIIIIITIIIIIIIIVIVVVIVIVIIIIIIVVVVVAVAVVVVVIIKRGPYVAQWLGRRNSNPKTQGSIPWRSRVRDSFSVPPSQLWYRPACVWLLFACTARTQICAHVKDPISICRKRIGLTAGGIETQKYRTQGVQKRWVA